MSELIDRAELFNRLATAQDKADCFRVIQEMPESIVRCKDCVYFTKIDGKYWCNMHYRTIGINTSYCSWGRKENR